jgi:hypothetical protein
MKKLKYLLAISKLLVLGITLTAAEAVIMNDLSFVPSDHLKPKIEHIVTVKKIMYWFITQSLKIPLRDYL